MKQLNLFKPNATDESSKEKFKSKMLGPKSKPVGYGKYIQSPEWRKKAKVAKELAGNKCQRCSSTGPLEVHHRNYESLYQEHFYDVEVLCAEDCHPQADQERIDEKKYESYLKTKHGDEWASHYVDDESEREKYHEWIERKNW